MSTDRPAAILAHLRTGVDAPEGLRLGDEEWLAEHPAGFGAVSLPSEGTFYRVDPNRLADLTAHLDLAELGDFLDAILRWWLYSNLRMLIRIEPADLIALTFEQDHPDHARRLLDVASHHGMSVEEFFVR